MASFAFNAGMDGIAAGTIVWGTDTIKARLVKSTATVDKDDTSLTPHTKITGTTDQTIGSKNRTKDTTNDRILFRGGNPTFSAVASGETVMGVTVFKDLGSDAANIPIFYHDVTDTPTNGGDITIDWPTVGSEVDVCGYIQQ
jgi:hypothetical protein